VSDSCLAWLRALYSESVVRSKLTFYPGTLHSQCSSLILQRFKPMAEQTQSLKLLSLLSR
jgi:hypothetical protein